MGKSVENATRAADNEQTCATIRGQFSLKFTQSYRPTQFYQISLRTSSCIDYYLTEILDYSTDIKGK